MSHLIQDDGPQEKLWRATLRDHAMPTVRGRPVDRIKTADVMALLLPIWNEKPVTARRVRQRVGVVMRRAVAQGYREDNPAGEAIGAALPKNGVRPQHHRALTEGPRVTPSTAAVVATGRRVRVLPHDRNKLVAHCGSDSSWRAIRAT